MREGSPKIRESVLRSLKCIEQLGWSTDRLGLIAYGIVVVEFGGKVPAKELFEVVTREDQAPPT